VQYCGFSTSPVRLPAAGGVTGRQAAALIDYALPRKIERAPMRNLADDDRRPGAAAKAGDLAVSHHSALGNLCYQIIDVLRELADLAFSCH